MIGRVGQFDRVMVIGGQVVRVMKSMSWRFRVIIVSVWQGV